MKNSIKKVALIIASVGCLTIANAQKIAHLSLDSLVSMMPETKTAKDAAQNYLKGIEAEVMNMQTELQTKYEDYLKNEANMAEVVKKNKQEELNSLQKRIEDFRQQAQMDYQRKYGELTAPIMDKAKKGIEAVAKEGGYKYVLDTSTGNVLYSEASDDILMAVKKKLDSMPAAVIPGMNNGNTTPNKTPNKTPGGAKGK
jgi:outer membrane protein